VKWLHDTGCPLTKDACKYAAYGGQLEVLKWLRELGCERDEDEILGFAAQQGQLETVKWAREKGCTWTENVCTVAAEGGQLEVLKWLRELGCPWDSNTLKAAIGQGKFDVFLWAFENRCPLDPYLKWKQTGNNILTPLPPICATMQVSYHGFSGRYVTNSFNMDSGTMRVVNRWEKDRLLSVQRQMEYKGADIQANAKKRGKAPR